MRPAPVAANAVPQLIEEAERLSSFEPRLPTSFAFVWENKRFAAKVEDRGKAVALSIIGDLCRVPYTAENPRIRSRMSELVRASRRSNAATFRINHHQRLQVMTETEIEHPVTGAAIFNGVTKALLAARPLMIFADELGIDEAPKRLKFRNAPKRKH